MVLFDAASNAWLAAGDGGALLRSKDGGVTWQSLETGMHVEFQALSREPHTGALLLGGSEGVIGRSSDGGATWKMTRLDMPEPRTPVTGFHSCGDRVFARSALGRMLVSTDAGKSWRVVATQSRAFFTDGHCDTKRGAIVLSSHLGDVFRSVDGGESWQAISFQAADDRKFLSALRADPQSGALILGAHHGAAFRSIDGGLTWQPADTAHTGSMESLLIAGSRVVSFGAGGFIVDSSDAGRSWQVRRQPLDVAMREVIALPDSRTLVASGELGGVLRSEDGGSSWSEVTIGYPDQNTPPNLRALVFDPTNGVLAAAGPPGTIVRSATAGQSWQIVHWTPLATQEAFPWLLVDPARARMIAIEARGSFYRSADSGQSWQRVRVDDGREFWQGALRQRDGWMLAAGQRESRLPALMVARTGRCAPPVPSLISMAATSRNAAISYCCWGAMEPSCVPPTMARAGSACRSTRATRYVVRYASRGVARCWLSANTAPCCVRGMRV